MIMSDRALGGTATRRTYIRELVMRGAEVKKAPRLILGQFFVWLTLSSCTTDVRSLAAPISTPPRCAVTRRRSWHRAGPDWRRARDGSGTGSAGE
jgi:hypothetical protein